MALVGVAALTMWLLGGVSVPDALLFVLYHVVFVVAPGWLVYRLLRPADGSRFRQIVFGWALGYVFEILAFAGGASVGQRELMALYPPVLFVLAALLWRRRVSSVARSQGSGAATQLGHQRSLPAAWLWVVAGLCVVALALQSIEYYGSAPLPNRVTRVSYGIDTVWYLSLAGEALHHWPVTDPTVSGEPLHYHLFSSFDPAAVTQITHIPLPVVFFRLYTVPLLLLAVLGLCLAGSTFGGVWTGPIAAALALFVSELNLDPHVGYRFANELGDDILSISPSFLVGVVLFAPLLALLCELQAERARARVRYGTLALLTLLVIGATGAKAPMPTVLGGGLLLYLGWYAVRKRALHRPLFAALLISIGVFLGFWLFSYQGAGSDQMTLSPPGVIRQMDATSHLATALGPHGAWSLALWVALTVVGIAGAYGAQLAGVLAAPRSSLPAATPLLAALFVFGLLPFVLYTHPGLSQVFFSESGLLAASLISAEGLRLLLARREGRRSLLLFGAGCVALAGALSLLISSAISGNVSSHHSTFLDLDIMLAVGLVVACVLALRRRRAVGARWSYVVVAVLAIGLTGRVLTIAGPTATELADGRPLYSQAGPGLTAGLYRALAWINTHSSPSSVIAVNNFRDWSLYWSDGWAVPDDFNYSAFAERPTFLEGYIYTQAAAQAPEAAYYGRMLLFRNRLQLNNAIFQWAHSDALRAAAGEYGVRYLLVDRVHNHANSRLGTIARLVYANRDAQVYAVPHTVTRPPQRGGRGQRSRRLVQPSKHARGRSGRRGRPRPASRGRGRYRHGSG
ncbi:MAG: hypothetical protein JOZ73_07410 [Solirubrobacterales bacterium]|nr:hypothetical protein [Solirubrobacterales bacterium]